MPVPVLDAMVRGFIESHLDRDIARKVVRAEPRMRAAAARLALREIRAPGAERQTAHAASGGEDWSWGRAALDAAPLSYTATARDDRGEDLLNN